ncbi:MAG TPA: OsmC family protein [Gemmatimonadales bacterium]|nr:OsmC family protein [Gemmatimonadales bacterium]
MIAPERIRTAVVTWTGAGLRFEAAAPGGPAIRLDGDGVEGPSPVVTLLAAAGACTGADVVDILRKMRVELRSCRIEVAGERRPDHPRRVVRLRFRFTLRGEGLDEARARRAVDLSLQKYCSVVHSLAPDIPIEYELDLG